MSSDVWMTYGEASMKLSFMGVQDAEQCLLSAINRGEIATQESAFARGDSDKLELRIADVDSWMNRNLGVEPQNRGGRPPDFEWSEFYAEIIRIALAKGELPKRQVTLINVMRDWAEKKWLKTPGDTKLKEHISKIYKALRKSH